MPLTLQTANGIQVATLNGPLDQVAGTDMVTTIKSSVAKGAPLVLDFTAVPHMDGSGFRQLLALKRWVDQGNTRLVLAGMNAESWALVVENNCTNTFEAKPSLAAAIQSLSPSASSEPPSESEVKSNSDSSSFDTDFGGIPEADSGVFSTPPQGAAASSAAWEFPPPSHSGGNPESWDQPAEGSGWEKFDRGDSRDSDTKENERKGASRKGLYIGLAAGLVITLGAFWLFDYLKEPTIRLDETSIEAQSGKELPAVSIWVRSGILDVENLLLPNGLDVVEGEVHGDEQEYVLTGSPKKAGRHEISFVATRENNPDRKSQPATIELNVTEVKLEWQQDEKGGLPLNAAGLTEKKAIPQNAISKVVTGAKNVSIEWQGTALTGVSLVRMPNTETSWQLAGTPNNAGTFRAHFLATKLSGETESKTFELIVAGLPPPPPPSPVTETKVTVAETTSQQVKPDEKKDLPTLTPLPPPPPDPIADEKMRGFLLERIEKANNHFTEDEKNQLRLVVSMLKEARLLGKVHFKTNSSEISSLEETKLLKSLKDPAAKKLLDDDDCQILVVGYADKTGKRSHNIKLSKLRAREVDLLLKKEIGRRADLSGDYGPTDVISDDSAENRVVEIYAGTIDISGLLEDVADKFKEDFNKHHGLR